MPEVSGAAPPARSTAVFTASVVVPTPPFGLKKVTRSADAVREDVGAHLAGSDEERHDPALELAVREAVRR